MLGVHLKQLRIQFKLPQRKIAAILDLDTATYSKIENELLPLKKEQIKVLEEFYQLNDNALRTEWLADKVYHILKDEDYAENALGLVVDRIHITPKYKYTPVVAEAHTPPYKIHKYFARRPHNVFAQLIKEFSWENDIVLDPFCGGGVTIYEGILQHRRMIGCDINPLSIFIIRNMVKRLSDFKQLALRFDELRLYISFLCRDYMYFVQDGRRYSITWSELARTVKCPKCGSHTLLKNDLKVKNGRFHCSNLGCALHTEGTIEVAACEPTLPEYISMVHYENRKKIVKLYGEEDFQRLNEYLAFLQEQLDNEKIDVPQDRIPLDWDRQREDDLSKKGLIYFQDLFSRRNLFVLLLLKNRILKYRDELSFEEYELVRMVFSSMLKYCGIMSFSTPGWQESSPTSWSMHAYWVPNEYCEVAIASAFEKAVKKVMAALKFNDNKDYCPLTTNSYQEFIERKADILLVNNTLRYANLPENSVDAIITDPPYGGNVQYLELSHFWYPWNKDLYEGLPSFEREAVVNRRKGFDGAKNHYSYEENLEIVFRVCYKVLKPKKYMCLSFNNKDVNSWLALLLSIFKSGFTFDNIYFQDGVKNYRQTAHTRAKGSPFGDFIYAFKKSENSVNKTYNSEEEFVQDMDRVLLGLKSSSENDRNDIMLNLCRSIIPLIDSFAKTYLINNPTHHLYDHFSKNCLKKIFVEDDGEVSKYIF